MSILGLRIEFLCDCKHILHCRLHSDRLWFLLCCVDFFSSFNFSTICLFLGVNVGSNFSKVVLERIVLFFEIVAGFVVWLIGKRSGQ